MLICKQYKAYLLINRQTNDRWNRKMGGIYGLLAVICSLVDLCTYSYTHLTDALNVLEWANEAFIDEIWSLLYYRKVGFSREMSSLQNVNSA